MDGATVGADLRAPLVARTAVGLRGFADRVGGIDHDYWANPCRRGGLPPSKGRFPWIPGRGGGTLDRFGSAKCASEWRRRPNVPSELPRASRQSSEDSERFSAPARRGGLGRSGAPLGGESACRRSGADRLVALRSGWVSHDRRRPLGRRHEPPHPPAGSLIPLSLASPGARARSSWRRRIALAALGSRGHHGSLWH